MGNTQGTRWRGKLPIPDRAHPLVREFIALLNMTQTTLTEVSQRAGIRRSTISAWRYKHVPRLPELQAALNTIGYELAICQLPLTTAKRRRRDHEF